MTTHRALLALLLVLVVSLPVAAHVPNFPADNTSPERAVEVPDAAKSWSFYDHLSPGEVAYYRFTLSTGERLQVGTFTPTDGAFTPSMVVMSPSFDRTEPVPADVEVPDGMGAVVVEGSRPETATYEPFAPSANYHTASLRRPVETETTFVLAVYEPADRAGATGVTVGYVEEFSLVEYLTVPFDLVGVHRWEGQGPVLLYGPWLLTLLVGLGAVRSRLRGDGGQNLARYVIAGAGLLVLGSGVNTVAQMTYSLSRTGLTAGALVTAVFVLVPVACGVGVLWWVLRRDVALTPLTRVGLVAAGLAGLAAWAGFVVGPAVLVAAAVSPARLLTPER